MDRGGSIVFRLLYNQLRAAYEPAMEALAGLLAAETDRGDLYEDVAAAIVAGESERASALAADLLGIGAASILAALDDLS